MQFKQAERRAIPVVLSLSGKSGSGKTYSALMMAGGLVGETGGDIYLIDTERGRGSMYADDPRVPPYKVGELHPPFSAQAFVDAIKAAQDAGAACIIVDSASHEWSGSGGCLEQVDDIVADKGPRMRMPAWGQVKAAHRRFVNLVAAPSCHLILCLRAKNKMVDEGGGKWVQLDHPVPEQQAEFVYEMTAAAMIDGDHHAVWTKVPEPLKGVLTPGVINAEQGDAIKQWVEGGAVLNKAAQYHLSEMRSVAFDGGQAKVTEYWAEHVADGKVDGQTLAQLKANFGEVKTLALRADEARERAASLVEAQDGAEAAKATPVARDASDPFADSFTNGAAKA